MRPFLHLRTSPQNEKQMPYQASLNRQWHDVWHVIQTLILTFVHNVRSIVDVITVNIPRAALICKNAAEEMINIVQIATLCSGLKSSFKQ